MTELETEIEIEPELGLIELATRENGGLEVRLLWNRIADELKLAVVDERTGETFEVPVPGESALDAFYHPFAYAPS
jgi:hypothetical protein